MKSLRTHALLLPALLFVLTVGCSRDEPDPGPASGILKSPAELTRSAWIGKRPEPLAGAESEHLRAAGITRLLWHSADIIRVSGRWQYPQANPVFAPPVPDGFERVPVLRLGASRDTASNRGSFQALGELIASYLRSDPADTLHIDYDCPDSLLPRYAELLGYVRTVAKPKRLSITALPGWAGLHGFDALQQQADEITVRLDEPGSDPPVHGALSVIDLETLRATLPRWRRHCRKPWLAGLPDIARHSLSGDTGVPASPSEPANPDATLSEALRLAAESGATGILWIPLPADRGPGVPPASP